jgi:hypothetical protein
VNPDLYGAWLTAGNNLQPAGAWIARNWTNLAIAAVLAIAACLIWQALRDASRRVEADLAEINDQPRKEERP